MSATAISFEALLNELDACTQTPLAHQELVHSLTLEDEYSAKAVNATTDSQPSLILHGWLCLENKRFCRLL